MDIAAIRLVQKYTEKRILDCTRALADSDGDPLQAIKSLIDEETFTRLRNDVISRIIVPNSLNGRPSPEEARVLSFLQEGR